MAARAVDYQAGQIRAATLRHVQQLRAFAGWAAGRPLDEGLLRDYRDHLLGRVAAGELRTTSVQTMLGLVRGLARWAYRERRLEALPRNLGACYVRVEQPPPAVLGAAEVATLLERAGPVLRCCIILGLNCGFTQTDLTNLRPDEVDWHMGIVRRKRSKTAHHPRRLHARAVHAACRRLRHNRTNCCRPCPSPPRTATAYLPIARPSSVKLRTPAISVRLFIAGVKTRTPA